MASRKTISLRLSRRDYERLELIVGFYEITKNAAIRAALLALCRQLGIEKGNPEDYLKKYNTT
jgi:hypothetical protein